MIFVIILAPVVAIPRILYGSPLKDKRLVSFWQYHILKKSFECYRHTFFLDGWVHRRRRLVGVDDTSESPLNPRPLTLSRKP